MPLPEGIKHSNWAKDRPHTHSPNTLNKDINNTSFVASFFKVISHLMPHRFVYMTATERFPLRRDNPSSVAQVEDFNTGVPNDGGVNEKVTADPSDLSHRTATGRE